MSALSWLLFSVNFKGTKIEQKFIKLNDQLGVNIHTYSLHKL